MSRNSRLLLALLCLALVRCAKPPTILRGGVEITYEQAAKMDFDEAEKLLRAKRITDASKLLRQIVEVFPKTSMADNALLRLAQIERSRDDLKGAVTDLENLLLQYPKSELVSLARADLGEILVRQKEWARASELFGELKWQDVPPERRASLEKAARAAFEGSGDAPHKMAWLLSVYDAGPPATTQSPERKDEILLLLDDLSPTEQEAMIKARGLNFPAGYAYFKLAKLAKHMGELDRSKQWLTAFLNRFPGHEHSREATELSESLFRTEDVDPHAIGLLVPLTGEGRAYAPQMLNGAALAMRAFEAKGSTLPPVRLYIEDVGDDPEKAAMAVEKLVRTRKVIAAVGPLLSRQAQSAAMTALEAELPILTMSAAEGITEIGPTVFRNSLTKSQQAAGLARLAYEILGVRRAAILYPENNYGREFRNFFWAEFEKRGGEIRGAESYDSEAPDFAHPVRKLVGMEPIELRASEVCSEDESDKRRAEARHNVRPCYPPDRLPPLVDFEVLFIPDSHERAVQIAPTLDFYDIHGVQLLGTNLWNTPEILQGDAPKQLQGAIFLDEFFREKKDPAVSDFVQRFYTVFGTEPGVFEAQAYDSVTLALQTIAVARPSGRKDFAKALTTIADFPGVAGETNWINRNAIHRLTVLTVDGEKIVELN